MAAPIACDLCGEEIAVMMQTTIQTGDVIAVGQACLITFMIAAATELSKGSEAEEQAAYADLVAGLLAELAPSMLQLAKSAVPRPPGRKRPAKGAKAGQPGPAVSDDEDPVTGDMRPADSEGNFTDEPVP